VFIFKSGKIDAITSSRVNAAPVASADVIIDYILDERLREFGVEEKGCLA